MTIIKIVILLILFTEPFVQFNSQDWNQLNPSETVNYAQTMPVAGEIVKNQRNRVKDKYGSGQYGASRDAGVRTHNGIDILATAGEKIASPFDGVITREIVSYKNDRTFKGVLISGTGTWAGYSLKIFYAEGLLSGQVKAGQEIAIVQNLGSKYPGISNHIQLEVRRNGKLVDPFEYGKCPFNMSDHLFSRVFASN